MGGSSWEYTGGLLGAVPLKRKTPGVLALVFLVVFWSMSACLPVGLSVCMSVSDCVCPCLSMSVRICQGLSVSVCN